MPGCVWPIHFQRSKRPLGMHVFWTNSHDHPKLVGEPVRYTLANLGREFLPKGGPQGVSLLRRKLGESVGNLARSNETLARMEG